MSLDLYQAEPTHLSAFEKCTFDNNPEPKCLIENLLFVCFKVRNYWDSFDNSQFYQCSTQISLL